MYVMSTVTVVTVWNKEAVFCEFTEALKEQKGVSYTLLAVDNSENRYPSARAAFNAQIDRIETEYVAFLHQDIRFLDAYALADIVKWAEAQDNLGVAGVAGCPTGDRWELISSIVHGAAAVAAGKAIEKPVPVQTVDECLFILRTDVLRAHPFSDKAGWHMYAVEQCLELAKAGYDNIVMPARIWHLSSGDSLDHTYLYTLEEMIRQYGAQTPFLNTTVKQWKTQGLKARLYRYYYLQKMKLKRFLRKRIPKVFA